MPILDEKGFIKELYPNEVIVVGTNNHGWHYGGAAEQAHRCFGLPWGAASGLFGQTYAFPTMDGLEKLAWQVPALFDCAKRNIDKIFHVTALGCGIAGHSPEEVAPFFKDAPKNCVLPPEFIYILQGESA